MSIGTRLRDLREKKQLSQEEVAKLMNVSRQAVTFWETDRTKPTRKLPELSRLFDVTADYILNGTTTPTAQPTSIIHHSVNGVRIPVLGYIAAGIPISAIEDILDYEEIPASIAATGEYFGLKIKGHSMEPKFSEGDVVIVRRQDSVESGDIAIVLVNGDEATVKKVKILDSGIILIATNTAVYEPHYYSSQQIKELPVQILGKVVELRAKF